MNNCLPVVHAIASASRRESRNRGSGRVSIRARVGASFAVALVGLMTATVLIVPAKTATALTSDTVNFQAKLMTNTGAIAPDGNYNVQFNLYSASTGGSSLWTETYLNNASNGIRVKNGYLVANLGSTNPFPSTINWDQDLYIGMTVRGTTSCSFGSCSPADGEMTPRLKLTAVPFAFSAGNLSNVSGSGFKSTLVFQGASGQDQTIQIPDDPLHATDDVCLFSLGNCVGAGGGIIGSGTQNYVSKFDNAGGNHIGNSDIFDDGTFVGIGTASNIGTSLVNIQGSATGSSTLFLQGLGSATATTEVIKQASSQTGDLLDFQDNSGNVNGSINATGNILSLGRVAGSGSVTQGKIVFADGTTDGFGLTLQSGILTANSTVTIPNSGGNDTVCLYTLGNCVGAGGGVTTAGTHTQNYISKFNNAGGSTIGNSSLYDDGSFVGLNTTTNNGLLTIMGASATQSSLFVQGAASASVAGTILQQGSGATAHLLDLQDSSSNIQASFNAAGNVLTLGNSSGSGTSAGSLRLTDSTSDGFFGTINLAGAIGSNQTYSLPTTGGTFCMQGSSGCGFETTTGNDFIQNQTGSTQTAGFNISGNGTGASFIATTSVLTNLLDAPTAGGSLAIGTTNATVGITLAQNTTIAAGKSITFAAGAGNFDQHSSTGTFDTGTGAVSLNGATTAKAGIIITNAGSLATQKGTDFATSGSSNDVNFGAASLYRLTGATAQTITGIAGGADGRILTLVNAGSNSATIVDQSSVAASSSLAANRIATGTGHDITLPAGASITLIYDSGASFWRVSGSVATTGSGGVTSVGAISGTSNANGATITGSTLNLTPADATNGGVVTNTTQTFAGAKTFANLLTGNAGLTVSGGAVSLQANAASVINTSSGNLALDAAGTLQLGTGTTGAVTIGKTGITTTIQGSTAVTLSATTGTTMVCQNGSSVLSACDASYLAPTATNFIQNQNSTTQTGTFKINGTGTAATFSAGTSVLTPLLDTASSGILSIGTTNATEIDLNQNVVVAAGKNLSFASGAGNFDLHLSTGTFQTGTGAISLNGNTTLAAGKTISITGDTYTNISGIASPTEGMTTYDTTNKQLLTYSNGKWKAASQNAIIVAASNSSQADKNAADYVATGTSDQTVINSALTAADPAGSGRKTGKVILLAGTYTTSDSISVPNNTTLSGEGSGTFIQFANLAGASKAMITNTTTGNSGTGVVIRDLWVDGLKATNTTGLDYGVYLNGVGSSTTLAGGSVLNVTASNFITHGIYLSGTYLSTVSGNTTFGNGTSASGGSGAGIYITGNRNNVNNNIIYSNVAYGLVLNGSLFDVVDGNTVYLNPNGGILLNGASSDNTITGNDIYNNGGNTTNEGIILTAASTALTDNLISSNHIADTSCSTNCYAIDINNSLVTRTYLSNNSFNPTGTATINDVGTNTIYAGQIKSASTNDYYIQPAGTIQLAANTTVTGNLTQTGGAISLQGNAASVINTSSGNLTLDAAGTLQLGTGTTGAVTIGKTGITTTIAGSTSVTLQSSTSTTLVCSNSGVLSTCDTSVLAPTATNFIQNQNSTTQTGTFKINGTGTLGTVQIATTGSVDTSAAGAINIGLATGGNGTSISLNQNVNLANGVSITYGTSGNFDQHASSGTFQTGTGAISLNGDVTVASGKNFTQTGAGTFSTGTGAVSLNGNTIVKPTVNSNVAFQVQTAAGNSNFTVNTDAGTTITLGHSGSGVNGRIGTALAATTGSGTASLGSWTTPAFQKTIKANHTLVGVLEVDNAAGVARTFSSITDTAGNTYHVDGTINDGGTNTNETYVFSGYVNNPISTSDTMTFTLTSFTKSRWAVDVEDFDNVLSASAVDKTATNNGVGTSFTSTATAATTQANELVFGGFGTSYSSAKTFTPGSGYTAIPTVIATSAGSGNRGAIAEWKYVTATGAQTANGTISSSSTYNGVAVTYKLSATPDTSAVGSIGFNNGAGNIITLTASPDATPYTLTLPTALNTTAGQCLQATDLDGSLGWAGCGVTLQGTTPGTADVGNIHVTGTIIADTALSSAAETLTSTTVTSGTILNLSQSTSAFTGTAILVNAANGSGTFSSGKYIDFQNNGTSRFNIDTNGVVTLRGGQTADVTTAAGTAPGALTVQPGNNTSASSTGASTTVQAGNDSGATSSTGGLLTLQGGNASGSGTKTGGGVTIDSGTGATAGGAIAIGGGNAASIGIGRSGITTTVTGNLLQQTGTFSLTGNGASTLAVTSGGLTIDTTTAAGQTIAIGNSNITHTVQIGTASGSAQTISIGSSNASSTLALTAGGGIALNNDTSVAAGKSIIFAAGAGNFDQHNSTGTFQTGTGAVSINGATTFATGVNISYAASSTGNFDLSNTSGTFKTGTGNVSLQGNTSVTGSNTFTVGTGLTSLGGGLAVTAGNTDFTNSIATKAGTTFTTPGATNGAALNVAGFYTLNTSGAAQTIQGILAGRDGQHLTLTNINALTATLANNFATSPNKAIITGTGSDVTLPTGASAELIYDATATVWRVVGAAAASGGAGVNAVGTFSTSNHYGNGAIITGTTITLGDADASNPGLIDTIAQTFAGLKTFNGGITSSSINTTGGTNTSLGNATGTFQLASTGGLNVSTTGALTGVASIDNSAAVTLGASTATSIGIGRSGITTTITGGLTQNTGAFSLTGSAASTLAVTSGGLTIDTTTTAGQTIAIGNSNITHTIQIGTASGSAQTITIGSSNASSTLGLSAGGGITLNNNTSVAAGVNITFAAGAGNFDQSASTGTFATGTGAVSLNGSTTVAAGKNFSFAAGAGNFDQSNSTGTFATGTGAVSINGSATIAAGKSITYAAGAGTFDMHNSTGTLQTGTGAVSINGSTTFAAGAGISYAASSTANVDFSNSSGTFSTTTGNVTLAGNTSVAAGKSITFAAGAGNFDQHNSTGTFQTGTGAVSINGATTFATTASIGYASSSTANVDFSNTSGLFKTGTGAVSLQGGTTVTGSNTFTVGTGLTSLGGGLAVTAGNTDFTNGIATKAGTSYTTAGTVNGAALNVAGFYTLNTAGAAQVIQGILAGRDGQQLTLTNINATAVTLVNNYATSPNKAIITGTGADISIAQNASVNLIYDATATVWRVVGSVGGTSVTTVGPISGTSNANGATIAGNTLTLTPADGTNGGVVTNTAQQFKGLKTFNDGITSTTINTTGGINTSLGNATGTFQLASTGGLNVSTAGALTGVASIDSSAGLTIGASTATSIGIGRSGITTTVTGGLTQNTGALNLQATGASQITTASGGLTIDTVTAAGQTIAIGNSNITHTIQIGTASGSAQTVTIGSSNASSTLGLSAGGGITLNNNTSVAAGVNITFAAGAGNFDQSSSTGTFATGTGTVSLNGATTVAAGKNFSFAAGAGNFDQSSSTGTFATGTGTVSINGSATIAAGKSITYAAGAGTFDMHNSTGTFQTGTGAVSINGATTFAAGAGISYVASSTANVDFSNSSGTFSTTTGAVTLAGNTSVAAGKSITFTAGAGNFDQHNSTGTFQTGTGAVSINGATTFATTASIGYASSSTANVDFSNTSGTFKTGTGLVSLQGGTTVTSSNTFTVGTGLTSLGGGLAVTAGNTDFTNGIATKAGTSYTTAGAVNGAALNVAGFYTLNTAGAAQIIQGILAGRDGQQLTLTNINATAVTLVNNYATSPNKAIITGTGADISIAQNASVNLIYDATATVWRVVGSVGGTSVTTVGPISGTSNANGATIAGNTLTLTPADGTNGGVVTNVAQQFKGLKTFNDGITSGSINTTAAVNTTFGNATGTFQLASSGGLNVSTTGALTGVASVDSTAGLSLGAAAATTSVGIGRSGITTTITGALTQQTGAFSFTGTAASQITTSTGTLLLQGAGAVTLNTTAIAGGSSAVAIGTGNASAGTAGAITIDNGTSFSGTSQLNIGNANAGQINIGHGNITTAITGIATVTNTSAATTLSISTNTTPTTAAVTINSTSGTGTDKLLNLQAGKFTVDATGNVANLGSLTTGTTGQFSVANNGDVTNSGKYNTNTFTASSLNFGSTSAATVTLTQSGASTAGGNLTISGGQSGTGAVNGGDLVLQGGASGGTGVQGSVKFSTSGFSTATNQNFTSTGGSVTQANVDGFSAVDISANAAGYTETVPAPTVKYSGRVLYLQITGSNSITLSPSGGTTILMNPNTAVTLIWNTTTNGWLNAGADSGSNSYIQNQTATTQTAGFKINGTGTAASLQVTAGTGAFDTAGAGVLNIGLATGGNATSISLNQSTTLAAGKTINITGDTYANISAIATPTEGMTTYDTTNKQLLVYSNGKWKASSQDAIIVAANNSSQADKNAADYVATGTADQGVINTALTAADPVSGSRQTGKVILLAGTYSITNVISVPNNVTLAGEGNGTLIQLANVGAANRNMITNTTTSSGIGVTIRDLTLDGNNGVNTGTDYGVYFNGMGTTSTVGGMILNLSINNLSDDGIHLTNSFNSLLNGNIVQNGNNNGIFINGTKNNIANNNSYTNNGYGVVLSSSSYDNVTGNNLNSNKTGGIYFTTNSSDNDASTNTLENNGANGTDEGIVIDGSSSDNVISNNHIDDTLCNTNCYAIDIAATAGTRNVLSSNSFDTSPLEIIHDLAVGTIYSNQLDGNSNLLNRSVGGGFGVNTSSITAALTLQGGLVTSQVPAPTIGTVVKTGTAGSTTYRYQITALDGTGESTASAVAQTTTGNATLSGTNYNTISWTGVPGAVQYNIYRCTGAACTPLKLATVTGSSLLSYNDQANGSPSGALPASNTTAGATIAGLITGNAGITTSGGAFSLTGNAASQISTTTGTLGITGAGNVTIGTTAIAGGSSTVGISTGNASAGTAGAITIDNGTSFSGTSQLNIGNANAGQINIGHNNITTAITGIATITNTNASTTLAISTNTTPTTAAVTINSTSGTGTDKLLNLQAGNFTVDASGNVVNLGGLTTGSSGQFGVTSAGVVTSSSTSTSGFVIQKTGGANVFIADTTNQKVAIGNYTAGSLNGQLQVTPTTPSRVGLYVQGNSGGQTANYIQASSNGNFATPDIFELTQTGNIHLGGGTTQVIQSFDQSAASTNSAILGLKSGNVTGATSNSGTLNLSTGNSSTSGDTGAISLQSGTATSGNTGNITIKSGAGTTSSGTVFIDSGSATLAANQGAVTIGATGASQINIGHGTIATAITGNVGITNTNATTTLNVTTNTTPTTAVITASSTSGTGTDKLLNLQSGKFTVDATGNVVALGSLTTGTTGQFSVANNGDVTNSGKYNTDTLTSTALTFGTSSAATLGITQAAAATAGGNLTIQGGQSGSGAVNGGDLLLQGGSTGGTGVQGNVKLAGSVFTTATQQSFGANSGVSQSSVDSGSALEVTSTVAGPITVTIPAPTIKVNGRLLFLEITGANPITISPSGGTSFTMNGNTAATLVWNTTTNGWLNAGADGGSNNYVQNQTATTQTAGFKINGAGTLGGLLTANAGIATSGGTFSLSGNASSTITTTAGNTSVDAFAVLNLGTSTATSIAIGHGTINTGITGNVSVTNTNATTSLSITTNTTPTTAVITANSTSGTATDKILNLQSGKFTVDANGNVVSANSATTATTGFTLNSTNASGTQTSGFDVEHTAAGTLTNGFIVNATAGTITNGITISNTSGAITHGIDLSGTIGSDIYRQSGTIDLQNGTDGANAIAFENSQQANILSLDTSNTGSGGNVATNGGAESGITNWAAYNSGGTPTQDQVAAEVDSGTSVVKEITSSTNQGAKYAVTLTSGTAYSMTFDVKASVTTTISAGFTTSNTSITTPCTAGSYDSASITTKFVKYTCNFTASTSAAANVAISSSVAATIYIDNLSVVAVNSSGTQNTGVINIGGGAQGQGLTLLKLDTNAGTPFTGANASLAGAMYFDTIAGKMQCYDGSVWGACGAAPNTLVTLTPEYAGAVLDGSLNGSAAGVGTLTSDFCANETTGITFQVGTLCATHDARNFYKWTSPQATSQTYYIYVTYKLPSTFKQFVGSTTQLTGLVDNTTNGAVKYAIYRKPNAGGNITNCSALSTVVGGGSGTANTWTNGVAGTLAGTTDPLGCGFVANDSVIFQIAVSANSNASAYAENLNFQFSNQ